jgi:hypothetical protein
METLSGFMAEFDKAMVVHKDVAYFGRARDELIELTMQYGQLNLLDISIDGYNDDQRSLYEVPEVRRWIKIIETRWPDFLFWLTPGSLWLCMLSLNPVMYQRLSDGRLQITLDQESLIRQFVVSISAAEEVLSKAGMTVKQVDRVIEQANPNIVQMFERKSRGKDYILIYPRDGAIRIYKKEK